MRMRSERQSRTLNSTAWDNSNWSPPTITVVSGGAVAQLAKGKFNPVTAASVKRAWNRVLTLDFAADR